MRGPSEDKDPYSAKHRDRLSSVQLADRSSDSGCSAFITLGICTEIVALAILVAIFKPRGWFYRDAARPVREEEIESRWEAAPAVALVIAMQLLLALVSRTRTGSSGSSPGGSG